MGYITSTYLSLYVVTCDCGVEYIYSHINIYKILHFMNERDPCKLRKVEVVQAQI